MITDYANESETTLTDQHTFYPARRTLFLSLGVEADAVACLAMQHGASWMHSALAAQHLSLAANDEAEQAVSDMLNLLADRTLTEQMFAQGFALAEHDELHLWLVFSDDDQTDSDAVEQLAHLAEATIDRAWEGLRLQTVVHLLLCGLPEHESRLLRAQQRLRQVGATSAYLAGPVNEQHVRLEDDQWHDSAAIGLALLAFGRLPSHTNPPCDADRIQVVGAALWPSPRQEILRWFLCRTTSAVCRRLVSNLDSSAEAEPDIRFVASIDALLPELNAALPPAKGNKRWHDQNVHWSDLDGLVERLSEGERNQSIAEQHQVRSARAAWLQQQIEAWNRRFEQLLAEHLHAEDGSLDGLFRLGNLRHCLSNALTAFRVESQQIESQLEQLDRRHALANAALKSASGALHATTDSLPGYSVRGALFALLQPWMWPLWLWRALEVLPKRGQELLNAQFQRRCTERVEGNVHLLRQLYLSQQMDVANMLERLDRLHAYLDASAQSMERECEEVVSSIAEPWTLKRLQNLWHSSIAGSVDAVAADAANADDLLDWPDIAVEDLILLVCQHIQEECLRIRQWHAADTLVAAAIDLPTTGGRQEEGGWTLPPLLTLPNQTLERLTQLRSRALSLWPRSFEDNETDEERWLVLPPARGIEIHAGYGYDAVRTWSREEAGDALASCPGDVVAVLRLRCASIDADRSSSA